MKSSDRPTAIDLDWIRSQPKAELHVHLLGAIRPSTALELARKNRVDFPIRTERDWLSTFTTGDLSSFVVAFTRLFEILKEARDFQRVATEAFEDLAEDGIAYAEPRITVTSHLSRRVAREAIGEGLAAAVAHASKSLNLEIAWIVDFPRILGPEVGEKALEEAIRGKEWGVVGFDVAGYEITPGGEGYLKDLFRKAKDHGLKTTAHAGEVGSPSHVRTALEEWHVDRIGHGTRAIEDKALVEILAERQIPLEICPTSNVVLGSVDSIASHPLDEYRKAGIPIVLNTDDPSLFGITLSREMLLVAETFGWSVETLREVVQNGWENRFVKGGLFGFACPEF